MMDGRPEERAGKGLPLSDEELEQQHFAAVVIAMLAYGMTTQRWLDSLELSTATGAAALPPEHSARLRSLTHFFERLQGMREAVAANELLLRTALADDWAGITTAPMPPPYGLGHTRQARRCAVVLEREAQKLCPANRALALGSDYADRVRSTLVQLVRDWSAAGAREREACYGSMLEALEKRWPDPTARRAVRVLNPGAGLGRLTYEVAARGFTSQGNEFSMFMLLMSNFVLNSAAVKDAFTVYPFVRQNTNVRCAADQLRPVTFPDIVPGEPTPECQAAEAAAAGKDKRTAPMAMSMTAGDFLEVYAPPEHKNAWDALLTPFFVDTAHNVLAYLDLFARILKPGALWVNCGPLLWHFADIPGEPSLELTWEELRLLIVDAGFDIVEERTVECPYASNERSLLSATYHAIFFVAVKKNTPPTHTAPHASK